MDLIARNPIEATPTPLSRKYDALIAKRWEKWQPWAEAEANRKCSFLLAPGVIYLRLQSVHRLAMLRMLNLRMSMGTIVKHELDSPLLTNEEREEKIKTHRRDRGYSRSREGFIKL
jgi:hypothetical protein